MYNQILLTSTNAGYLLLFYDSNDRDVYVYNNPNEIFGGEWCIFDNEGRAVKEKALKFISRDDLDESAGDYYTDIDNIYKFAGVEDYPNDCKIIAQITL